MYLFTNNRSGAGKKRGKSNRRKAAYKAKQRRRVNGMLSRSLGKRLRRRGSKKNRG